MKKEIDVCDFCESPIEPPKRIMIYPSQKTDSLEHNDINVVIGLNNTKCKSAKEFLFCDMACLCAFIKKIQEQ